MIWLLIGVGGGLGAMARHALNGFVHRWWLDANFPYGIFIINVLGSAAIGLFAGLVATSRIHASLEARTFIVVGLFGGFTTFSSFSLDTLTLLRNGSTMAALGNIIGQVALSLIAVALGYRLGAGV